MKLVEYIKAVYNFYRNHSVPSESSIKQRRNNLANRIVSAQVDREGFCEIEPSLAYASTEGHIRRGSYLTQEELEAAREKWRDYRF